jgi:hypothetical protein
MPSDRHHYSDLAWSSAGFARGVAAFLYSPVTDGTPADVDDAYSIIDVPACDAAVRESFPRAAGRFLLIIDNAEFRSDDLAQLEGMLADVMTADGEVDAHAETRVVNDARWIAACGGTETWAKARDGREYLYVWWQNAPADTPAALRHGWLDRTDVIRHDDPNA